MMDEQYQVNKKDTNQINFNYKISISCKKLRNVVFNFRKCINVFLIYKDYILFQQLGKLTCGSNEKLIVILQCSLLLYSLNINFTIPEIQENKLIKIFLQLQRYHKMKQFLPYLKSKELENQFRYEQHNNNRKYFMMLCIVEIVSFSYGFGRIISDGIINSKLISSYVTIILAYGIIFLFNLRNLNIGFYLMPLIQCFFPVIRWVNDTKNLSMSQTPQYIQGFISVVQFSLHIQSPNYFYKIFCVTCYVVQEAIFNTYAESDQASYAALIITFCIFFIKQFQDDQRLRFLFLQSQSLYMWFQLIDTQLKMNFFVAKPSKNKKNSKNQNQIDMHFVNKQALSAFSCNTSEKFNAFLEKIIIQEEEEENNDDFFRSRFLSEKLSSNRLFSMSKNRSSKKTLFQICQQIIQQNQKNNFTQTLSTITACQEYTGIISSQKFSQTNSKKFDEGDSQQQQDSQGKQEKEFKPQTVQIKLYYYNLTEEYLIIQIEEEDYKLKAKKQREEQKKALAFRDHLTHRMKLQIENIISSVKMNFEIFKQLPNYKSIMLDMYLLKQYQQNIITTFTDFNINMPFEVSQVNLKLLINSLLNLFSEDVQGNKPTYSNDIFSYEHQEEVISTQSNLINHVLFNLMLNCKQYAQKSSEIQIKVSQDNLDENIINIEVVNQLNPKEQEYQLLCIEEMMRIQTQEELFAFYFQRQKLLDNMITLKQLRNEIRSKQGDTPDHQFKKIKNETLKYTLGIFVSRQSLKRIGPSGQISYTITKVKDKQYLIASFQIYKDIEQTYKKEKEVFVELFGRNSINLNLNSIQQYHNNFQQSLKNINNKKDCQDQNSNENLKQQMYPQQQIKEFLMQKAKLGQNNLDNQQDQEQEEDQINLQNFKNQIINSQLQLLTDQALSTLRQVPSQQISSNQSANNLQRNSLTNNIFNHQKSLFYRDTVEDQKNLEEMNNDDSLKLNKQLVESSLKLRKQSSPEGSDLLTEIEENDIDKNIKIQQLQDYKQNFKKNPGKVDQIQDENDLRIEQGMLTSKYHSILTTNRENLIPQDLNDAKISQRSNLIDQLQTEDQNTFSTPNMYGQSGYLLNQGDTPLLQRKIKDK